MSINAIKRGLKFVFPLFILINCTPSKYFVKQQAKSILVISGNPTNVGTSPIGITLYLENVNTNEVLVSKSIGVNYKYAIISNLAPGDYIVKRIDIRLSDVTIYNRSVELKQFFGLLKIEPNSKYFLGNYTCYQTSVLKRTSYLQLVNHDVPEKIQSKVENPELGWGNEPFIKLEPINYKLLIYH